MNFTFLFIFTYFVCQLTETREQNQLVLIVIEHFQGRASQVALVGKNLPANAGDASFDTWLGKIP